MILIVTHKEDPHPNRVIDYILKNGSSVFRLNTEELLTDYTLNCNVTQNSINFFINTLDGLHDINLNDCSSVWIRRAFAPNQYNGVLLEQVRKHNLIEAKGFLDYMLNYISQSKFTIGSFIYDSLASSKILQYIIAEQLGMKIPNTCFSNKKEDIIQFAKQYEFITLKPIKNDNVYLGGEEEFVFFTQKIKSSELAYIADEVFSQTINFVQEYIEKSFELRITTVCDDVFACKILSQEMDETHGKIDWRQGIETDMKHEPFRLPVEIANFCRKYLKSLNLNFGCFDFIVTPQDEYVFLECNPNGQWMWIEELTGLKISNSIAKHLLKSK